MSSRWWTFACIVGLLGACEKGGVAGKSAPPPAPPASNAVISRAQPSAPAEPARLAEEPAPPPAPPPARGNPEPHHHVPLAVCRSKGDPLDAARRYYDAGQFEEALSCSAQATAFFPDLPQAHSEKGAALSALGRFPEAQLAYARALAIQPNHLDALLGAAHLYAVSMPSSRENDELASAYAERGLALAQGQKDKPLIAQFALVSAMAFNDLGQARDALSRADEVLRLQAADQEASYERAVALFELCRFDESKKAFLQLLEDEDRGAHAHHHVGLILEREGQHEAAEKHFTQARKRAPEDFPSPQLLSEADFKAAVAKAVEELPADMRRDLAGVPVTAEELPLEDDLLGGEPPLSPTILGLFRGPPLGDHCFAAPGQTCRSVALYRRNLARAVRTRDELFEQIRVTLLHEVGHLRGEDDFELAARGLE